MTHLLKLALACAGALTICAQTPDYGRNFKGVLDANNSTRSRPFRVVTTAPSGACTNHEWAWSTTAAAIYHCPAGSWAAFSAGGSGVTSFATRTGAVVADVADYASFYPALTGSYANPSWVTSLAASKISGLLPLANGGTATDTSAMSGVPKYTLGIPSMVTGTATDCVKVNGTSGSCGGGATGAYAFTDFLVTKTSATVLAFNNGASASTPVNFGNGAASIAFTGAVAPTLSGSTASSTAYAWLGRDDACHWGHNGAATLTVTGCTPHTGTTGFPTDGSVSRKLWTWAYVANVWAATGTDFRSVYNAAPSVSGSTFVSAVPTDRDVALSLSATGTPSSSTFLRGDNVWGTVSSGVDPFDGTKFYKRLSFESGFNRTDDFNYTGGCIEDNSDATGNGMDTTSITPWWWLKTNGNTAMCGATWPFMRVWGGAIPDLFSGSTPVLHKVRGRLGKQVLNGGTFFVGWTQSLANLNNAIGCRSIGTGNWFAVIRASAGDIATADTGAASSTSSIKPEASNGVSTATANSITCTVGASSNTATGTIPAGTNWFFFVGSVQAGASASVMRVSQAEIFLQGLP